MTTISKPKSLCTEIHRANLRFSQSKFFFFEMHFAYYIHIRSTLGQDVAFKDFFCLQNICSLEARNWSLGTRSCLQGAKNWFHGARFLGAQSCLLGARSWFLGTRKCLHGDKSWLLGDKKWVSGTQRWLLGTKKWVP